MGVVTPNHKISCCHFIDCNFATSMNPSVNLVCLMSDIQPCDGHNPQVENCAVDFDGVRL